MTFFIQHLRNIPSVEILLLLEIWECSRQHIWICFQFSHFQLTSSKYWHINFFAIPIASFIKPTEIGMFRRNITRDPSANVIACNSYPWLFTSAWIIFSEVFFSHVAASRLSPTEWITYTRRNFANSSIIFVLYSSTNLTIWNILTAISLLRTHSISNSEVVISPNCKLSNRSINSVSSFYLILMMSSQNETWYYKLIFTAHHCFYTIQQCSFAGNNCMKEMSSKRNTFMSPNIFLYILNSCSLKWIIRKFS